MNTLTETITVRGTEYPSISGETAIDPATKIIWSLLKIASTEAYEMALETRDPVTAWQKLSTETDTVERNSAFLFSLNLDPEIEPSAAKNPRVALENNLRKLIPSLPTGLGATELIEFINAVLPQEASKKKNGFSEEPEPEVPTLEAIAGREISPEEIAAATVEGKPLEDAIAAPLIPIPDTELVKLRPDLMTIEEQDLQAALAEQMANRLTVVSTPAPLGSDELEDLI